MLIKSYPLSFMLVYAVVSRYHGSLHNVTVFFVSVCCVCIYKFMKEAFIMFQFASGTVYSLCSYFYINEDLFVFLN
jgi:hypothetical protein